MVGVQSSDSVLEDKERMQNRQDFWLLDRVFQWPHFVPFHNPWKMNGRIPRTSCLVFFFLFPEDLLFFFFKEQFQVYNQTEQKAQGVFHVAPCPCTPPPEA